MQGHPAVVEQETLQLPSTLDVNQHTHLASNFGTSRGDEAPSQKSPKGEFLPSLEAFRAIAIVCVVAGHSISSTGWIIDSTAEKFIANIILGGTNLFVFISGYLFHHVFKNRYTFIGFMQQKAQRVLLPYLFLSVLPILMAVKNDHPAGLLGAVTAYLGHLTKGDIWICYWYVPFVIAMFALSPIHRWFATLSATVQVTAVGTMLAIASVTQRPINNIGIPQLLVYFTPVYLAGVTAAVHRQQLMAFLSRHHVSLFIGAIGLAGAQALFATNTGSYHRDFGTIGNIDLQLIQKILLCGWLLYALQWFDRRESKAIGLIAASSFAVFFLHPYVLDIWLRTWKLHAFLSGGAALPVAVAIIHGVSILCALGIRKVAGKRSRYLIGW
ncbi:MAG: acyltransferase family protein [Armatimonadota bacterium]